MAGNGPHAVTMIEQWPARFTLLVTDYHMPCGMTGADLVMHMRQSYPTIPMIIATALVSVVTEDWLGHHRVDILAKPYDPEALVGLVNHVFRAPPSAPV